MNGPLLILTTVPWTLKTLFAGQIRGLVEAGFEVHAASSPGEDLERFAAAAGVPVHPVPMQRRIVPVADLLSVWRIWRLVLKLRPSIVHAHTPKAGLVGMLAAWLAGVPFRVYTVHGLPLETHRGWIRWLLVTAERLSCALAHEVVAVSPSVARELAALRITTRAVLLGDGSMFGISPERFNAVRWRHAREGVRQRYGIPRSALLIGFVGRIVRDKGIVDLASAWPHVRDSDPAIHLLLCGAAEEEDPVPLAVIRSLRACPRVHWTGGMVEEMPAIYAALDLLVLPTYREGLPTVVLEAAAMEVPAVVTAVTGAVDAVVAGETGLLVPPRDPQALSGAIRRLAGDPCLRARLGASARERVVARFSGDRVLTALLALYRRRPRPLSYRWAKRILDVSAACLGLLALAPVLAAVAIAVRLSLGSPVLFRQDRLGYRGRPFRLYKFRTMTEERSAGGCLLSDAVRLTRLGCWLRASSLDELPQLVNVLRGEMSLVGPRPLLPQYWERYSPTQRRRHDALPGITGWAQIHGRNAVDWDDRFALDIWYVDHADFLVDLGILLRTVAAIFARRGIRSPGHSTMPEFLGSQGERASST
ncbi:MAG: sugar transferase [Bryobacterales bacterium]|nr:sugar transferase [Bryobacterales bacterium]